MRNIYENQSDDTDEHNQPTEPMAAIILSPHAASPYMNGVGNGIAAYQAQTIPAPLPLEVPFPQNGQPAGAYPYLPETPQVYPVLPPSPLVNGRGRPPGGGASLGEKGKAYRSGGRQSSFPALVGALFVLAQLVLLVRVVLLLFGIPNTNIGVELVYAGGAMLAWPVRLVLEHIHLPVQPGGDFINYVAALVAILLYGVLARILVRFLKALLNSR